MGGYSGWNGTGVHFSDGWGHEDMNVYVMADALVSLLNHTHSSSPRLVLFLSLLSLTVVLHLFWCKSLSCYPVTGFKYPSLAYYFRFGICAVDCANSVNSLSSKVICLTPHRHS